MIDHGVTDLKDLSYILTYDNVIYHLEEDFGLWAPDRNYSAIGIGKEFALGSLATSIEMGYAGENPKDAALLALQAAAEWSPWVRGPFVVIEV